MDDRCYSLAVKRSLEHSIDELAAIKSLFLQHPEKDFTRNRIIDFKRFIQMNLQIEGSAIQNEILKFFSFQDQTPTASAFCQQRAKVLPDAFEFLFHSFTEQLSSLDKLKMYRDKYLLVAADGSDLNVPFNPDDEETFFQVLDKRGYNKNHLNALYDIYNGFYHDAILSPIRSVDERSAFITMVDRFPKDKKAIFIADRGYESFNAFVHVIESGNKFLIRVKDPSSNGILNSFKLPDGEFDVLMSTILTQKRTKHVKEHKDTYTIIPYRTRFDFTDKDNLFYPIKFRVISIKVAPDVYEYLVTNLDSLECSSDDIKHLYHLRWEQETSFRDLKYTIDLVHLHAKKRSFVDQEIWSKLILYNFCEAITRHISKTRQTGASNGLRRKWSYKVNFATAVSICKAFLKGDSEINVCRLIGRFLIPIRPNRHSERNIKVQSAKIFLYRAA